MNWVYRLSSTAEKDLKRLPKDRQVQLIRAIEEMDEKPLDGDVKPLKGPAWKGWYRKRVGPYRIIFSLNSAERAIEISAIAIRSEKTYR